MSPSDLQPSAYRLRPIPYRGRFAPSPTGPLHFGSLVAAVGSYLQAKCAQGQWLVRIEDLDPPRAVPGSADLILKTLEDFGFEWDEAVIYQSSRAEAYESALQTLRDRDLAYPCSCTRSELQVLPSQHVISGDELHYPGICRVKPRRAPGPHSWRLRVASEPIAFIDALQGAHAVNLHDAIGDFIIKRRDGLFAYQLAVVVDDAAQGITEVVRGADLLFNTPRQVVLQQALALPTPHYLHLPLATDAQGNKLSKSNTAPAVSATVPVLWQVLHFLRQQPPIALQDASLATLWAWAIAHWQPASLTGIRAAIAEIDA